jgi:hypothetical protein
MYGRPYRHSNCLLFGRFTYSLDHAELKLAIGPLARISYFAHGARNYAATQTPLVTKCRRVHLSSRSVVKQLAGASLRLSVIRLRNSRMDSGTAESQRV